METNPDFIVVDAARRYSAGPQRYKKRASSRPRRCCEGWDRTTDLRVMSPTSYRCSTSRCGGQRYDSLPSLPNSMKRLSIFPDPAFSFSEFVTLCPGQCFL